MMSRVTMDRVMKWNGLDRPLEQFELLEFIEAAGELVEPG